MDYSTIKVNEIYSEGGDFIELTNVGPAAVDVSDWVSGASKNAVLRYEPGTSMNATDEWSLNALLPVRRTTRTTMPTTVTAWSPRSTRGC